MSPVLPLLLALGACLGPHGPLMDDEGLEAALVGPWEPTPAEVALPVPGDVAQAALTTARSAGVTPTPWAAGPPLAPARPGVPWTWNLYYEAPDVRGVVEVDSYNLLWSLEPWATLEDGEIVVRWETRFPTPPAAATFALRLEEDPLAPPRYRRWRREEADKPSRSHEVRYPVAGLMYPVYDVDRVAERGWGEVNWRVESYHPIHGASEMYEGRTAFRMEGDALVQAPTLTLGPYVDQLLGDSAVIWLETDVPTAAAVAVGGSAPVVSSGPATRHEIAVGGLAPGAVHVYQVAVSDGEQATLTPYNTLRTRVPGSPVVLAMASDSRSGVGSGAESVGGVNAAALRPLLADAARREAEAIVFPGDLVDGYTTRADHLAFELRTWLRVTEGVHASLPIYTTVGNHEAVVRAWSDRVQIDRDGAESTEAVFAEVMVNPGGAPPPATEGAPPYDETVYSFDIEGVHVAVINTNYWYAEPIGHERLEGRGNREGFVMSGQLDWLEADLATARDRGAMHLVVAGHEPAFPVGGHVDDAMYWDGLHDDVNAMRERFWRILSDHGVLAYFWDEHSYSRALIGAETVPGAETPVWSIISGGCGAPWYGLTPPEAYAERIMAYSAQQHYTLWTFHDDRVELAAIGLTGEVFDEAILWEE